MAKNIPFHFYRTFKSDHCFVLSTQKLTNALETSSNPVLAEQDANSKLLPMLMLMLPTACQQFVDSLMTDWWPFISLGNFLETAW